MTNMFPSSERLSTASRETRCPTVQVCFEYPVLGSRMCAVTEECGFFPKRPKTLMDTSLSGNVVKHEVGRNGPTNEAPQTERERPDNTLQKKRKQQRQQANNKNDDGSPPHYRPAVIDEIRETGKHAGKSRDVEGQRESLARALKVLHVQLLIEDKDAEHAVSRH